MKPLLFLSCIMCCAAALGQQPGAQTITGTNRSKAEDSIFRSKNIYFKSKPDTGIDKDVLPYNGMPNAFYRKLPPDVYVGNNGQGQDIYHSQVDNMAILKPDSSFQQAMPNPFRTSKEALKTYPSFGIFPPDPSTFPKGNKQPKK